MRKTESKNKKIADGIDVKDKKISELKNVNRRYSNIVMKSKEIIEKLTGGKDLATKDNDNEIVTVKKLTATRKCPYENTGKCRKGKNCEDYHPKKKCQMHSKLGSCFSPQMCVGFGREMVQGPVNKVILAGTIILSPKLQQESELF